MFRELYKEVKTRQEARDILRGLQQTTSSADEWYKIESVTEYLEKTTKALIEIPYAFGTDFGVLAELHDDPNYCNDPQL